MQTESESRQLLERKVFFHISTFMCTITRTQGNRESEIRLQNRADILKFTAVKRIRLKYLTDLSYAARSLVLDNNVALGIVAFNS